MVAVFKACKIFHDTSCDLIRDIASAGLTMALPDEEEIHEPPGQPCSVAHTRG